MMNKKGNVMEMNVKWILALVTLFIIIMVFLGFRLLDHYKNLPNLGTPEDKIIIDEDEKLSVKDFCPVIMGKIINGGESSYCNYNYQGNVWIKVNEYGQFVKTDLFYYSTENANEGIFNLGEMENHWTTKKLWFVPVPTGVGCTPYTVATVSSDKIKVEPRMYGANTKEEYSLVYKNKYKFPDEKVLRAIDETYLYGGYLCKNE